MQFSLVQMLSGAGAPPAVLKAAEGDAADISGGKANFAAMLGDANAQQQSGQGRAVPLPVTGVTAKLLAQEIDAAALVDAAPLSDASLQAVLAQPITPAKAKELLTQVEVLQASVAEAIAQEQAGFEQSGTPQEQWQQGLGELAEALQEIANGEQTVTVGEVVEGLPIATAEPTTEGVPTLQRMLRWMQAALDAPKETPTQAAIAPSAPDAAVQSLQASLFPAGNDAAAATPAPGETEDRTDETEHYSQITQITPLAHTQQAGIPAWVHKLTAGADDIASDEIQLAIPTLRLPEETPALPEVALPGSDATALAAPLNEGPTTRDAYIPATAKFNPRPLESLQPLPEQLSVAEAVQAPVIAAHETDAAQPVANVQALGQLSQAAPNASHLASTPTLAPVYLMNRSPAEQVQVALTTATRDGIDHMTLQLEPADLGRVEVRMEIGNDGRTQLSFLADKPDTLDALARDARSLERALHEAGVKADAGSMQFNLRQQPQPQFGEAAGGNGQPGQEQAANDHLPTGSTATPATLAADGITTHYTIDVQDGVDIEA